MHQHHPFSLVSARREVGPPPRIPLCRFGLMPRASSLRDRSETSFRSEIAEFRAKIMKGEEAYMEYKPTRPE